MRAPSGRSAHWPVWVILLTAVPLFGCGSASPRESVATGTDLPELALPDLSTLTPAVRDQIRERHARLSRLGADPATSDDELGTAYGEVGLVLMAAGFSHAAATAYLHARARSPSALRWPYYLGHLHRLAGEPARAAGFFETALEIEPSHLASLVWLGESYLDHGRPALAERRFERALTVEPASAAALSGVGRAALARGDARRAVEYLRQALAREPGATSLHYSLAMAHRALGDQRTAESHLRQRGTGRARPPDPLLQEYDGMLRSALAYEARGLRAMEAGRAGDAVAIFREGLELTPTDPALRHRLGTALMATGDAAGAIEQFEATLRAAPDFARAHYGLGVVHSLSGRPREAVAHFRQAVEHQPNYLEAHLGLAEALRVSGQREAALAPLERVTEIDPAFAEAWHLRAMTLVQLERLAEAHDWLGQARLIHPEHPELAALMERVKSALGLF